MWAPGGAIDFRTFLRRVDWIYLAAGCLSMFFDFQFRSLCGIARIPYAAGGLEQQVVELPPQNYSVAKILKKARLQGPVSGCQNQPKTDYVRRYLQS